MTSPPLAGLLDRQAGVVSRAQALAAGLEPRHIDRLVARRRWWPVHPRVYLVDGRPLTDEVRVRAAALWAGDGAVLAGFAAVWWHGLVEWLPPTVAVTVPRRCPDPRPGVVARRRILRPRDVVALRGVAVPIRPLALLDAAVEAGPAGPELLASAVDHGVRRAELDAVADSSAGAATARRLLGNPPRESTRVRNRYS
jgi:hypothetical protein